MPVQPTPYRGAGSSCSLSFGTRQPVRGAIAMITAAGAPSQTDACRALKSADVDIAVLQETKLMGGVHTRNTSGYAIVASKAVSASQGGVALVWKNHGGFEVEETKIVHANVLTFQLVVGAV